MSNPFKGTFYVNSFEIISNSEEWSPVVKTIVQPAQLLQYYHIPDLNKSRFVTQDLCNPAEYPLLVLESEISTMRDLVNFSNPNGFSLCMNIALTNNKPKMLLAKTNLSDRPYFLFAYLDQTLYFFIYTKTKFITLSKVIEDSELASYLNGTSLYTMTISKNKIILYRGVTEIAKFEGMLGTFRNHEYSSIENYIQASALKTICSTIALNLPEGVTLDEYVAEVEENKGRYVRDLLVIDGTLSLEDIYYINILMST